MTNRCKRMLKPTHLVYWLAHFVLLTVGIALVLLENPIAIGCGSSLIAAGVTGWVVFAYVLVTQRTADQLELLRRFGILNCFDRRSVGIKEEYTRRLGVARDRIDIMGFGLSALREDFADAFEGWQHRARVRILILDPDAPTKKASYAKQRDAEEGNKEKTIETDIHAFVRSCAGLIRGENDRFQVRLYASIPAVNIFRIDDEMFWGPYLVSGQSRNLPTFLVGSPGALYERLEQHFEAVWKDFSRDVPSEWLESTT